jgi:hypothetical protein
MQDISKEIYINIRDIWRRVGFVHTKYFSDFIFIHINKTGGSSIEKALKAPLIHKTAIEFKNDIGHKRWEQRFSFAIVRNPWDRAVSQFHYRQMINKTGLGSKTLSFNEWVKFVYIDNDQKYIDEEKMFLPQSSWVTNENGNIIVNYIGKFEEIQSSWDHIAQKLNRERTQLPHIKKSSRKDYRTYYNDDSIEIIEKSFELDIKNFGYTFE